MSGATVKDYVFDNMSRIGNDACGLSQQNIQFLNAGNYMLQNYFIGDCNMSDPIHFATSQPGIFYEGSNQVGIGGCNIDINSNLLNGSIITHPRSKISLNQRPFITVPYLGRGECNPMLESRLIQGDVNVNKKSVNVLSEQNCSTSYNYPMLSSVAANMVPPDVNGIRGGMPSREFAREKTYSGTGT